MTKHFSKWASKHNVSLKKLRCALSELKSNNFDANLGGCLYKKRVRFEGRGKRSSGRTVICYQKESIAIFIHGFAKNEKENLSTKELIALKEFSNLLLSLSEKQINIAIKNGDFKEV